MFRNRQPAWPYRCTGKDARTGVFFFALRAGAARAFPAAGHARGREAAASPAVNTAARRRPARGANRARPTRACASWDGAGGGIAGREHGGAAEVLRAAQTVRAQPARAPHGTARAAASRQGTRRRGESRRAAQIVRAQPARAPRGMAWAAASRQGTRRRGESRCAAQTVRAQPARAPRGMARAAASPTANTAARRKPVRGADRVRQTLPDGAKRQSLAIITILNHISKHCQENRRCRAPAAHPTTAGCFNSNTRR